MITKGPNMDFSGQRDDEQSTCSHNVYIKGLCGNCGVRLEHNPETTSVSMIHSVPELKVSQAYARCIGQEDQNRLIQARKLVLLVDLDHTVLHTTHEEVKDDPSVHSFTLLPGHPTYHTKLRPHLKEFLDEMSKLFELHIFTFGCRRYADRIASFIDPKKEYFGDRILSRDESVDQDSKRGNLNNLFPCGDAMVCIIDDRADVWGNAGNLIQVKPFFYFKTSISDGASKPRPETPSSSIIADTDECTSGNASFVSSEIESSELNQTAYQVDASNSEEPDLVHELERTNPTEGCSNDNDCDFVDVDESSSRIDRCIDNDDSTGTDDDSQEKDDESLEADVGKLEALLEMDDQPKQDDQLPHIANILRRIHSKWYMEFDERTRFLTAYEKYRLPDIKDIIKRYLRKRYT